MSLVVKNLSGGYNGSKVLDSISFNVDDGKIVALIGLNGAGKSTTINYLIGLLPIQTGNIELNGQNIVSNSIEYKQQIAYIPETPILYQELTLREHLEAIILAYKLDSKSAWDKAEQLLKTFRLEKQLDWFPTEFSKGMKQKVMLVAALMTDAKLLIIDEPFLGLDPLAVDDLTDILEAKKREGVAILLTTHVVSVAEKFVDEFILLDKGKIRIQGTSVQVKKKFPKIKKLDDIYQQLANE